MINLSNTCWKMDGNLSLNEEKIGGNSDLRGELTDSIVSLRGVDCPNTG
jgi:hypothetical protein